MSNRGLDSMTRPVFLISSLRQLLTLFPVTQLTCHSLDVPHPPKVNVTSTSVATSQVQFISVFDLIQVAHSGIYVHQLAHTAA